MEEIFKGLVERAQYYEQFESFRNTNLSGQFGDIHANGPQNEGFNNEYVRYDLLMPA